MAERRLFVSTDFTGQAELSADIRHELATSRLQSGVVFPLLYRDIALGSISLLYDHCREFGEIELDSFTTISNTEA